VDFPYAPEAESLLLRHTQKSADLAGRLIQSRKSQQGRAVVARTMNSGSIVIAFGYGIFVGALIRCNRVFAAITPISRSGCRTSLAPDFETPRFEYRRSLLPIHLRARVAPPREAPGSPYRRYIIEREQRCKCLARCNDLSGHFVTELRRRRFAL